ncbi:MAG: arginine-tRNA-protein transferase [Bernardetiaceae bacterium]|jgi:arginine-tRNA-protein transferase|nr:arginine-tRNA-protein transferase [Bernardetiaceae bacterium]
MEPIDALHQQYLSAPPRLVYEQFYQNQVAPAQLDDLLATGWRHFGTHFYRYNLTVHEGALCWVVPLRVDLAQFAPAPRHRKISRRNQGWRLHRGPIVLDQAKHQLFDRHKARFKANVPEDLFVFLSHQPATVPGPAWEVSVYDGPHLLATSFLDLAQTAVSSVYGMFDPAYAGYSLGIYTMLLEMELAQQLGKRYYYPGYSYSVPSHYDYKKQFAGLQLLDWRDEQWHPA